jgi:hypothetical protein
MLDFTTSLVREKIEFVDDAPDSAESRAVMDPVLSAAKGGDHVIRSNRLLLALVRRGATERLVVRAKNMHSTLRFAGKILHDFYRNGMFANRAEPFHWEQTWQSVLSDYEHRFTPDIWSAVYINGKPVYRTRDYPFVDVVERCALEAMDDYDATMGHTRTAFQKIGRSVRINHTSSVATVLNDGNNVMRCGITHRGEGGDGTFNFMAIGGEQSNRIVQSVGTAADFVEALNLHYIAKVGQEKASAGRATVEDQVRLDAATARLGTLRTAIRAFEEAYNVSYSPAKPALEAMTA